jgi:hypothetical protein
MPEMFDCPCCLGHGVRHRIGSEDETDCCEECPECGATGQVTPAQRDELLDWRTKCRARSGPVAARNRGKPRAA